MLVSVLQAVTEPANEGGQQRSNIVATVSLHLNFALI